MRTDHPLTLTVEQAGHVLGIGRSTAYELVHSGDLKCIHLRRRIVIPVAHLAERLGATTADVWTVLAAGQVRPPRPPAARALIGRPGASTLNEAPTLF